MRLTAPLLLLLLLLTLLVSGCGTLGWSDDDGGDGGGDTRGETSAEKPGDSDSPEADDAASKEDDEFGGDGIKFTGFFKDIFGDDSTPEQASDDSQGIPPDADAERLRQEIARLRASLKDQPTQRRPASAGESRGPAIAVAFGTNTSLKAPMLSALNEAAGSFPLRLLTPGRVEPLLRNQGCTPAQPRDCLSALAVEPGARLLAVVAPRADQGGDRRYLSFRLYDTDLGLAYDPVTLSLPRQRGESSRESWVAAADALLLHAQDHLRLTPPIVRAVKSEGETIYLNQGAALGLEAGNRLTVHRSARLLRGPGDSPVAWIPAPAQGVLEITRLTPDGAVARLVSGKTPASSDFLIPDDGGA